MKKHFILALIPAFLLGFSSCSDDNPAPSGSDSYYIVQTLDEITQVKPGFMGTYAEFPSGVISNVNQTGALQGQGNEGLRTYNGMVFKMFNASFERGIYKLHVASDGRLSYGSEIKTGNTMNGSGNFVIENDTRGYYWDVNEPWDIQLFNPTTMVRNGKLNYDFESELKKDDTGITWQGLGQHLLVIKEGKLYADIVYSTGSGMASGMFDDYFDDVYIAVIDLATGSYEKTIIVENTGSIAFINDNEMYSFDGNGDLYIVCQGTNGPLGENSKIIRIKANETDIDANWVLKYSDYNPTDEGKFTGVLADNGRLILTVNQEPLTAGPTGNINSAEMWKFYSVDIATRQFTAIEGVELSTNGGGAYPAFKLDGKTLLRVNAPSKGISGIYELNGTTATPLFRVAEGHIAGFTKIKAN